MFDERQSKAPKASWRKTSNSARKTLLQTPVWQKRWLVRRRRRSESELLPLLVVRHRWLPARMHSVEMRLCHLRLLLLRRQNLFLPVPLDRPKRHGKHVSGRTKESYSVKCATKSSAYSIICGRTSALTLENSRFSASFLGVGSDSITAAICSSTNDGTFLTSSGPIRAMCRGVVSASWKLAIFGRTRKDIV